MNMSWPFDASEDTVSLRGKARDSLFVKAHIAVDRLQHGFDIVVRNISAGGLLADTTMDLELGDVVKIELRRVGVVPGRVVWVQPARFGVAFDVIIDPQLVRQPVSVKKSSVAVHNTPNPFGPGKRTLRF